MTRTVIALLAAAACASCATRYTSRPPLAFSELPYVSLSGAPWPEHTLELPATAARYGLPVVPRITYVELNPEGARTVVLVHGLGSYLKFWRHQLDWLASQGFRVVAIDLPGYGKSDKPASFPYTMDSFAVVLAEVIDTLLLDRPVVVGHSMGGHIGLVYAIAHPGALRGLVLVSPAGFEAFSARERGWLAAVARSELYAGATEEDIWHSVRAYNFAGWRDDLTWLIEERVRVARSPEFGAYAYANALSVRGLSHTELTRQNLGAIDAPTLIVYGEGDALIPNPFMHGGRTRDVMEVGHRGIRGSKLTGLPGCGHSLQLDCPDAFNAALGPFLASLPE